MAFQLLSYAVEKISGKRFTTVLEKNLIKPLKLTRTFLHPPVNDTNSVIFDAYDLGDAAP